METNTNIPKPVSLEAKLRTHWEENLVSAELMVENAQRNLARITTIYGGQLSLDDCLRDYLQFAET